MPRSATGAHTGSPIGSHPLDTEVRAIMTPGVVTLADDADLQHAFRALSRHGVHAVLVTDHATGESLGWVTARGLCEHLESGGPHVKNAISQPVVAVDPGATIRQAAAELAAPGITHLLVTHGWSKHPEGVVTHADIVGFWGGR